MWQKKGEIAGMDMLYIDFSAQNLQPLRAAGPVYSVD